MPRQWERDGGKERTSVSSRVRTQLENLQSKLTTNSASDGMTTQTSRSPRLVSGPELEREKKAALSGMMTGFARLIQPEQLQQPTKEGKILHDPSGGVIDLDAEFARLHAPRSAQPVASGNVVIPVDDQIGNNEHNFLYEPGAIAVSAAFYEGPDEDEPDFVNPDNFDAELRSQATELYNEDSLSSSLQMEANDAERLVQNPLSAEYGGSGKTVNFIRAYRKNSCMPFFIIVIMLVGIGMGMYMGVIMRNKRGINEAAANQPTAPPSRLVVTSTPTVATPTWSPNPSPEPSSSPTQTAWISRWQIKGPSFGKSVQFATNLIVFSDGAFVFTQRLVAGVWKVVGSPIDGDLVCLSKTQKIAVRNGGSVSVYGLSGEDWLQIGTNVIVSFLPEALSISGDGSTIAISAVFGTSRSRTQVYRFDGFNWATYGSEIVDSEELIGPGDSSLSYDGTHLINGYNTKYLGYGVIYKYRGPGWEEALRGGIIFGGGPAVAWSRNQEIVVCGGAGTVTAYNGTNRDVLGTTIFLDGFLGVPLLSITVDGRSIAYAWRKNLRVIELVDSSWLSKGVVPAMAYDIDSISFSSTGMLAVGQSKGNMIEILEIFH